MENIVGVVYGLLSAVCWGTGDFNGGLASKKSSTETVVLLSQFIGLVILLLLGLIFGESFPSIRDLLVSGLAGIFGVIGLLALYQGLATGRMGIVAPVAAVVATVLPVLFAIYTDGFPGQITLAGFVLALIAVWLISRPDTDHKIQFHDIRFGIVAGLGFGLFFVFISLLETEAVFFPLVAARVASIVLVVSVLFYRGQTIRPQASQMPLIALSGIFDSGGNAFFVLAEQAGRLDVATVLSSLYPAFTILLAWLILKEKISQQEFIGIALALLAVVLIAR